MILKKDSIGFSPLLRLKMMLKVSVALKQVPFSSARQEKTSKETTTTTRTAIKK